MVKKVMAAFMAVAMVFGAGVRTADGAIDDTAVRVCAETFGDYEYVVLEDGSVRISRYVGSAAKVMIPARIDGRKVTEIGESAFEENKELKSVSLPCTVRTLGEHAFFGCDGLKSLAIPSSVTELEWASVGYEWQQRSEILWVASPKTGFMLYCFKNTEAEKYAEKMYLQYKLLRMGDVDHSGEINLVDLALVTAHAKSIKGLDETVTADVNGDGEVNLMDVTRIAAHVKGIETLK